jgi:hypothetical protein
VIGWGQKTALIRFFYKVEPEKLSIDEWAKYEAELVYLASMGVISLKLS